MKITPVEHGLDLLASDLVRSPGLHASDIYGALFKEISPKRYGRGGPPNTLMMSLGTAWEVRLEYLLKRAGYEVQRPGEFMSPGGWALSPDLVLFNGQTRIGEIKLTWMSSADLPTGPSNGFPPKFDKHMVQIMDGCHTIESPYARIYVTCVNGRYKPPAPELLVFDLEFTARELRENFDLMLGYAQKEQMFR